jgi:hypothetical protein
MTYQEYTTYMKVCDYLGREPEGDFLKMETHIDEIWSGAEFFIYDRRPLTLVVVHNKKVPLYIYNPKSGRLRIVPENWKKVKRCFDDFSIRTTEARDFITGVFESHLKCEIKTTVWETNRDFKELLHKMMCVGYIT